MRPATDLQTIIRAKAGDLFVQQGYTATTIKQIAAAAGCTTAALYYYFEGGKSHILREVVRSYAGVIAQVFDQSTNADSLPEFVLRLGHVLATVGPAKLSRMSWILADFGKLQPDEQRQMHQLLAGLHAHITREVGRFVEEPEQAQQIAWLIFCAYFGYEQVFLTLDAGKITPLSYATFAQTLAHFVTVR